MKDKKPKPKRWRQDRAFVSWMLSVEYATRDPKLRALVSEGQAVYLWEAWRAGRESMTSGISQSGRNLFAAMRGDPPAR